jgi:hypothetical protein
MRTLLALVLGVVIGGPLQGEEAPAKSRIVSVALFKNGLAVVKREIKVEGPGTYRLEDVPEPVHGTYWVESTGPVETRVRLREVSVPVQQGTVHNLQEELAGKQVTIYLRDKTPPVQGKVVELTRPRSEEGTSRTPSGGRNYWDPQAAMMAPRFLILQTKRGRVWLDPSQVVYVEADGMGETIKQRKPELVLTVKDKGGRLNVSYLTRGIAWAPSYRVDITDPKVLTLEQSAVIKNEFVPLEDAEVFLISGFPSIQLGHVTSPLSLRTTWGQFFQELSQRLDPGNVAMGNSILAQNASFNRSAGVPMNLSANPAGEGVDMHYQSIGKQTLGEDESLSLSVAKGKAEYQRIVEWLIPDTRDAYGNVNTRQANEEDADQSQDAAWDALRFKNPLTFPMTTGPAMVVAKGRFNGQRLSGWVNSGEETILRVTKALSLRTHGVEQEDLNNKVDERSIVFISGRRFRRTQVAGDLAVSNHRQEPIALVIRRRFSGELIEAEGSPKLTLREEGVYSVNKRNELVWSFTLKPGEERKLAYHYSVLVDY